MGISIGVGIILAIYVLAMGFSFWFCVIADPDKSPTARFIAHTLPAEVMKRAHRLVGNKGVKVIETIMERLLAIIYLTVVLGGFLVMVIYCYPKARESPHIPDYHLTLGYVITFLALWTWRLTMTTSPGVITKDTLQYFDHYPYDDLLYVQGRQDRKQGIPRIPRSKFDRLKYHQHVPRFDHYCGWVASTIGEENYRIFLLFVLTQLILCVYGTVMLTTFFKGEIKDRNLLQVTFFDRTSGKEYPASKWIVFQYLFHQYLIEAGLLALMGVMSVAVAGFLGYHIYITSKGMTTNEHYKWGEVRKWHTSEIRKYEEYKKQLADGSLKIDNNMNNINTSTISKPPVPDGDVTCTGGKAVAGEMSDPANNDDVPQQAPVTEDPGPMPTNIYNRGFLENWKEVLFPVSIQRKKTAAKAAEKAKAP